MTSDPFVWTWLGGRRTPVVAGRVVPLDEGSYGFVYGKSYLARGDALPLGPDLPLIEGAQLPAPDAGDLHPTIRDACPDSWGQRVIEHRLGHAQASGPLGWPTLMMESGSNRIGALDFQSSATDYVPRQETAPLAELLDAAQRIADGGDLAPALAVALEHGTSVGGARPKVLVQDERGRELIAKMSSSSDVLPVVKAEGAAMEVARRVGLDVAESRVERVHGRDVLLVRRFDRTADGGRRQVLSGLGILGLHENWARYATYPEILATIDRNSRGVSAGPELFGRIAVSIAVSNSDDHARNTAVFWDGRHMSLTPAYDLAPGARAGETATQAMAYGLDGQRASNFAELIRCAGVFHLTPAAAADVVERVIDTVETEWEDIADMALLTTAERRSLRTRQFLNPGVMHGFRRPSR